MISLNVNGKKHRSDVCPEMLPLSVIRDVIGLTRTKFEFGVARCGCGTVHIDGVARLCVTRVGTPMQHKAITAIEALGGSS